MRIGKGRGATRLLPSCILRRARPRPPDGPGAPRRRELIQTPLAKDVHSLMKLIGAGLPRTATTTQMFALEQVGLGPCYHMRDLLLDLDTGLPLWEGAYDGSPEWERIFGDAKSTVDWPSARYYAELMDYYPDAKVLLSVREPEDWVRIMRE